MQNITIYEEERYKSTIHTESHQFYDFVDFELCRHAIFIKLNDNVFGEDVLLCSVYFEPEGSAYFNRNVYSELEYSVLQIGVEQLFMTGDFNSRTGQRDEILPNNHHVDDVFNSNIALPPRISQDKHTNNMGHSLLSFCSRHQLVIVNGRVGEDAGIGKVTCKNASVVDYAIISKDLYDKVDNFLVLEFNEFM